MKRPQAGWLVPSLVVVVLVLSVAVRIYGLGQPHGYMFDEVYYAKDAHTILQGNLGPTAQYNWMAGTEISWPHPEVGKFLIAVGIAALGNNDWGWRLPSALVGAALLAFVYPMGRRLGLRPVWALAALMLAATDTMLIAQSRIATLDIFIAFFTVACVYLALRYVQTGHRLRWLALCGVAGGLALATKWSGLLAVVVAMFLMLLFRSRRWQAEGARVPQTWLDLAGAACLAFPAVVFLGLATRTAWWQALLVAALLEAAAVIVLSLRAPWRRWLAQAARDLLWPAAFLVAVPAAIYMLSYTDYFAHSHGLGDWWQMQKEMWYFNFHLHAVHTYASHAWTWLIDYRPVWYAYDDTRGPVYGVVSIGNPFFWWTSLAALVALPVAAIVRRRLDWALPAILVVLLYAPWLDTSRTSFIYYMTPVVPFMAVMLAMGFQALSGDRWPTRAWLPALVFAVTACLTSLLWHPIGKAFEWAFWRAPSHVSTALGRGFVAGGVVIAVAVVAALFLLPAVRRQWSSIGWAVVGACTGICLAFLPIVVYLPITQHHFRQLMWFRNWI
jgi:dolichyl-phosphate-mannose--protein O-mannosyl transferase